MWIMNRIEKVLKTNKKRNKKSLIGYITAGYPTASQTPELVNAMVEGGVDIVELGVPSSDPLADGPVIQETGRVALEAGLTIPKCMDIVRKIRETNSVPILFMVYFSTIFGYGVKRFIKEAIDVGIDGLIVPDLPMEERNELNDCIPEDTLLHIPLVGPTSLTRTKEVVDGCRGFVYCVSSLGVTGRGSEFYSGLEDYIQSVRDVTDLPIAIGFGVKSKKDKEYIETFGDAVIVGTKILEVIKETNGSSKDVKEFIASLN